MRKQVSGGGRGLGLAGFERESQRPDGTGVLATLVAERLGYDFVVKVHGLLAAGFVHNREFLDLVSPGQRVNALEQLPQQGEEMALGNCISFALLNRCSCR